MIRWTKSSVLIILVASMVISPTVTPAQNERVQNFELKLIVNNEAYNRLRFADFIKSSLYPLGIDIDVIFKDFSSFAGSLVREESGIDWDMAIVSFVDPSVAPPLFNFYHSNFPIGSYTYPLNNSDVRQAFYNDNGVNISAIDQLIADAYFSHDTEKTKSKIEEFSEIFMNQLLYDVPLLKSKKYHVVDKGFRGYNESIGITKSFSLGAKWIEQRQDRNSTTSLFVAPALGTYFDQYRLGFEGVTARLVFVEGDLSVHPDIAMQWEKSDWEVNDTVIEGGKHTFWLRENAYWANTETLTINNHTGPFRITPYDFAFNYDLQKTQDRATCTQRDRLINAICQPQFHSYSINESQNSISFYITQPSYTDIETLETLRPLPHFMFNDTVSFVANPNINGTVDELFRTYGIRYDQTAEYFNFFFSRQSTSGPYYFSSNPIAQRSQNMVELLLREDYWYPNEWDAPAMDFIIHQPGPEEAYYNTYNSTEDDPYRKPTSFYITRIIGTYEGHPMHQNGDLRVVEKKILLDKYRNDPEFVLYERKVRSSAEMLVFNFLNEHLQKYKVRRAIGHAINKEALTSVSDHEFVSQDSPIWPYMDPWYTDTWKIEYDYATARDLMRSENYYAAESNINFIDIPHEPTETISIEVPIFLSMSIAILVIMVRYIPARRRKGCINFK